MRQQTIAVISVLFIAQVISGQETDYNKEHLKTVARKIMENAHYCALITIDENGFPAARTMDPFEPDSNFIVWFGTNIYTRKVRQLKNNPKTTLYYFDHQTESYVMISGIAITVRYEERFAKYWKEKWKEFYPDFPDNYLLVKFVPERLEVSAPALGIYSDPETWRPPTITFSAINH